MSKKKDASVPAPSGKAAKGTPKGGQGPAPEDEDPALLGLMTEIEDDLRAEEFKKLWSKYGTAVIAIALVVVIGVAGWQIWRQQQEKQRIELARSYEKAVQTATDGNTEQALTEFAAIAGQTSGGYAVLAQLQKASLLIDRDNDLAGALAAYRSLMDDPAVDPLFRDLATVLYALHAMDSEDPAELEARLTPILNPNNAFYYSAVELTALLADKQGDSERAVQLIDQLIADSSTPIGIHQRAEELAPVFKTHRDGGRPAEGDQAVSTSPTPAPTAAPTAAPSASNSDINPAETVPAADSATATP